MRELHPALGIVALFALFCVAGLIWGGAEIIVQCGVYDSARCE